MAESKRGSTFSMNKLLTLSSMPRNRFAEEYKKYDDDTAKELNSKVFCQIEDEISCGNLEDVQKLSKLIYHIIESKKYPSPDITNQNLTNTILNLITLSCKHNQLNILTWLLDDKNEFLSSLCASNVNDEAFFQVFYYSIRSGNVELMHTILKKWPGDYFTLNPEQEENFLSKAYEELKLKNVPLKSEMEYFVEDKLINLRFFSDEQKEKEYYPSLDAILDRMDLLLESIALLIREYADEEKVDERFLYVAKFIAQNIYVLKSQLKCTYDRIPWEEIEFCIISFVSAYLSDQKINVFFLSVLSKERLLNHLENFAAKLLLQKDEIRKMDVNTLSTLPNLKREEVVAKINIQCPLFAGLYSDHKQVRDIYSLHVINTYIDTSLSSDCNESIGQIAITRVLQVIGEHLKNTLESPKLSGTTSDMLMYLAADNTCEILIALRNSLSHSYSFSIRDQMEEKANIDFYKTLQNDLKKIKSMIMDILYQNEVRMFKVILQKIVDSKDFNEMRREFNILERITTVNLMKEASQCRKTLIYERVKEMILKLQEIIPEKTDHEEELFTIILQKMDSLKPNILATTTISEYFIWLLILKGAYESFSVFPCNENSVRNMKYGVKQALKNINSDYISKENFHLKRFLLEIFRSIISRLDPEGNIKLWVLFITLFSTLEFDTDKIEGIEDLKENLKKKKIGKKAFVLKDSGSKYADFESILNKKLNKIRNILDKELNSNATSDYATYKNKSTVSIALEMLVLDVFSLLEKSQMTLSNNLLSLDSYSPSLIGKSLRNHLAHSNAVISTQLLNPTFAVLATAKFFAYSDILQKGKIGKLFDDHPSRLRERFLQGLKILDCQRKMCIALEKGNLEELKFCIDNGGEINISGNDLRTSLHYASKNRCIEMVKFVFSNSQYSDNYADKNFITPLHVASANGIASIVKYFIKGKIFSVKASDSMNRSPLHYAVLNCQKHCMEILVEMDSNINQKDFSGLAPIHLSVMRNNPEIVKFLLHKGIDIDCEANGGFTCLHIAAENGFTELVNFLIEKGANVNTKSENSFTPLHTSCLHGHTQIVKSLISKGSNINAQVIDGCTALHFALENDHEDIAQILLVNGANVNFADKIYNNTPLHYASQFGLKNIAEKLLSAGARVNAKTSAGITPLHLSALYGHRSISEILLKNDAVVNSESVVGASPLHYSAMNNYKDVAEYLIQNSADVNKQDIRGLTSLHLCSFKGNTNIVEFIIASGAKVDAADFNGVTALHLAVLNNHKDSVDVLMKYGADLHARNSNSQTILHFAVINKYEADLFLYTVENIAFFYEDKDKNLSYTFSSNNNDKTDIVKLLIQKNTNINASDKNAQTPLHFAAICGNDSVTDILIKHGADINFRNTSQMTPLHYAVKYNRKENSNLLIKYEADVNIMDIKNCTPLCYAVKNKCSEIVKALVNNGADVNVDKGHPLKLAAMEGNRNIVKILLQSASINLLTLNNALREAVTEGYLKVVEALIIKGADMNEITVDCLSNLRYSEEQFNEFIKFLIGKSFNVNNVTLSNTTFLHFAALNGYNKVVEMLLKENANTNVKNNENMIPIELAIYYGHLQVVKTILQHTNKDINARCDNGTLLHICAKGGQLDIAEYLVSKGADINASDSFGLSPIYSAASCGHVNMVEYLHKNGYNISNRIESGSTLLHSAVLQNSFEVIIYLLEHKVEVNKVDKNGLSALYYAVSYGFKETAEYLLNKGAIYNTGFAKSLPYCVKPNIALKMLDNTKILFRNIKQNEPGNVETIIKEGVFINALDVKLGSPLHYCSSKDYGSIVDILLKNKANPNVIGKEGSTPLHYASKFNHLNIVISLLSSGAIYNFRNSIGKIPQDYADKEVKQLLVLIDDCFKKIQGGNLEIICDLHKVKCTKTLGVLANVCNKDNQTILVSAVRNNFSKLKVLKRIFEHNDAPNIFQAELFTYQEKYEDAENMYRMVYEDRKDSFREDSVLTIDSLIKLVQMLYKQGKYQEALSKCQEAYVLQKGMLGMNNIDTLNTQSLMALILHRLGREDEALSIFRIIAPMQEELLGARHDDTINTKFHMALVLAQLKKFEEALNINYECFNYRKEILGMNHPVTLAAYNNIAMVLSMQGIHEKALKIYKRVYDTRKRVLGPEHSDTLRALGHIAEVLIYLGKDDEGLSSLQKVLNIQQSNFGQAHPDTLYTVFNIGLTLFRTGKLNLALKIFIDNIDRMRAVFGPNHSSIKMMETIMEAINIGLKMKEANMSSVSDDNLEQIFTAANSGDVKNMKYLLKQNIDINISDDKGQTLLHVASYNGHIDVVKLLLSNNSDATKATHKGNTPLHIASLRSHDEIVEVLLHYVKQTFPNKFDNFINAQTISGGKTALHVAAEKDSINIVKSLLTFGAIYNVTDNSNLMPVNLSKNQEVVDLLKLAEEIFELAIKGSDRIIKKLRWRSNSDIVSLLNTRNNHRQTLVQVALVNNHKFLVKNLLKLLQKTI